MLSDILPTGLDCEVLNGQVKPGDIVVWSYPRGGGLSKDGEMALDVTDYAAHIVAQLGAHIIKVKLPTAHIELEEARKVYEEQHSPA